MRARRYKKNRQFLLGDQPPQKVIAYCKNYLYYFLGELLIFRKIRKKFGNKFRGGISGVLNIAEKETREKN